MLLLYQQVRSLVQVSDPDPSMFGALPPGAWWEVANGAEPVVEAYADKAGDAAVVAARSGDLELCNVMFAYPVRKEMAGGPGGLTHGQSMEGMSCVMAVRELGFYAGVTWGKGVSVLTPHACVRESDRAVGRAACKVWREVTPVTKT